MAGYNRNDTVNNIADGNIINASDLDGEFDAIDAAFDQTTGHEHDGTSGGGKPITKVGPTQDVVVGATAVTPKTDNTVDLGSSTFEFKDLYIDGTANIDSLVADTVDINAGTIDGVTIATSDITVGTGKTLNVSAGTLTLADNQISGDKVEGGTINAITINTLTSTAVNTTTVDATNVEVANVKAKDGTAAITIADTTGAVAVSTAFSANGGATLGDASGDALTINSSAVSIPNGLNFDSNTLVIDAANNRVGIGTASPAQALHINGFQLFENAGEIRFKDSGGTQRTAITLDSSNNFNIGTSANGALIFINGSTYTERMRIDGSGNVGIGTSSPSENLDVSSSANGGGPTINVSNTYYLAGSTDEFAEFQAEFYQNDVAARRAAGYMRFGKSGDFSNNANASTFLSFATRNAGTLAEYMRIVSSGNVGIGTTSPNSTLEVNGEVRITRPSVNTQYLKIYANVSGTFIEGVSASGNAKPLSIQTDTNSTLLNLTTVAAQPIVFNTTNTERMRIDSSGNLLLGKTAIGLTTAGVQISSGDVAATASSTSTNLATNSGGSLRVINNSATDGNFSNIGGYNSNGLVTSQIDFINISHASRTGAIAFLTHDGSTMPERMRIDSSGRVGIGLTNPSTPLDVYGAINVRSGYNIQWGTSDNYIAANTSLMQFGVNGSERMRIDSSGNVGIGTSSPVFGSGSGVEVYRSGIATYRLSSSGAGVEFRNNSGTGELDVRGAFPMVFSTNATERMRIDSSGNVLIGTTSAATSSTLNVVGTGYQPIYVNTTATGGGGASFQRSGTLALYTGTAGSTWLTGSSTADGLIRAEANLLFAAGGGTERMRINSVGTALFGKTTDSLAVVGTYISPAGEVGITQSGGAPLFMNRLVNDGTLVQFRQDDTAEGSISVSGTTVSYNGGHLSRYAQTLTPKDDSLLKGTVMSNLDEMNQYVDAEGNPVPNEQLNKVKVSDVEGDVNVAGVFVNWSHDEQHNVDEINMAMTGDMIIRIAQGVVVQKGDLLMSAGDGTAKPQGDDIVRSKTIAKVTSNHVTCTYADGSYCVPCVLMAC